MSSNKKKKIILKTNKKTENKYTGTDDQIKENVISETFTNSNVNQKGKQKANKSNETAKLNQNLTEQKKDIKELTKELNSLKSKLESERIESMESLQIINNELDEKNRQLKLLTNNNYKLIEHLKNIGKNCKGEFLKMFNEKMKKRLKSFKNDETLKYDIIIKEEEIKNARKIANEEKRQKEKYENLLNEVNNGKEQNIANDLKDLNDKVKQLNEDIMELSITKSIHNNCKKNLQNLNNKLNLYKTEFEFESKRNNMLINKAKNPQKKINMSFTENIKNLLIGSGESFASKINYGQKIREGILKANIQKPEKLNLFTYRYINSKINLLNKSPNEKKVLIDTSKKDEKLFTKQEYDFLHEIIPSDYMNKYIDEYESRKKEKEEIKNKFGEHKKIKSERQQFFFKIDYIDVKLKEVERKHLDLIVKFRNNNRIKNELNEKIKIYEKEMKKYNKMIERKEKLKKIYLGDLKQE